MGPHDGGSNFIGGVEHVSSDLSARSWVSTLGWYEVWVVAACSAVPCLFMMGLFEWQRHRRTSFWPRSRYCPGKVLESQYPGFMKWAAPLKAIPDDEMVELVGLEAFVFIRFMRMGIRMTAFGSIIAIVLLIVFGTTPHDNGEYQTTFYSWTIGNVVHRSGRLWAPVLGSWFITAHALYELLAECKAFVRLRQAFMTTAEKPAEGANIGELGQLQSTFSVMVERIPSECRSDAALRAYFEHLFPGQVVSAVVSLTNLNDLESLLAAQERVVSRLEHLLLEREVSVTEPTEWHADDGCASALRGRGTAVEAIPFYTAILSQLNAKRTELLKRLYLAEQAVERMAAGVVSTDRESLLANEDRLNEFGEEADTGNIVAGAVLPGAETYVAAAAGSATSLTGEAEALLGGGGADAERPASPASSSSSLASSSKEPAPTSYVSTRSVLGSGSLDVRIGGGGEVAGLGKLGRGPRGRKDDIGAKGGTGFVTFRTLRTCALARQAQLSPRPFCMEPAQHRAEPRNVIWMNVTTSKTDRLVRHNLMSLGLVACAFNWSMVMALCEHASDVCIFWQTNTENWELAWFYYMLEAYAPILLVNLILCVLPFLFKFIAEYYERFKFTSEVQQVVFRRYLMFQWANIWLALVSGTIWTLLELLAEEPMTVLEFIAAIMPQAAVYFVEMIIMKLMLVLPFEISRLWPWFRIEFVRRGFKDRLTDRDLATGAFEPPEFRYGFQYPSKLMVLTYAFVFAGIAPIVYPFALLFFYCAYFVYTRQFLYVYVPYYEAGGAFFEIVIYSLLASLVAGSLTFTFYLLLIEAYYHALASVGPIIMALVTLAFIKVGFGHMNQNLALESAIAADAAYVEASEEKDPAAGFSPEYFRQPVLLQGTLEPILPWHDDDDKRRSSVASPFTANLKRPASVSRARSAILFRRAANNEPTLSLSREPPVYQAETKEDLEEGDGYEHLARPPTAPL